MAKSIKLVTFLGDEEVVVGRCHPGQARILRKHGLADWKKDKLVLNQPQSSGNAMQARDEEDFGKVGRLINPAAPTPVEWPVTKDHLCGSLRAWLTEAVGRREKGNILTPSNDSFRMRIGFIDHTDGIRFTVPVFKIKQAHPSVWEDLGVSREAMRSQEGREALLGYTPDPYFVPEPEPEWEDSEDMSTLTKILVEEAEQKAGPDESEVEDLSKEFGFTPADAAVLQKIRKMTEQIFKE